MFPTINMVLDAIAFGILQGILEWLPVSSQGNLVLLMVGVLGYGVKESLKYSVFLHTGTLLAAIVYFRKDIISLLRVLPSYRFDFSGERDRIWSFLLITTLISGLIGYPLFRLMQTTSFTGEVFIGLVGIALIATGLIQRSVKTSGPRNPKNLNLKDTIILGITQGFSAIPGISRSGITTSSLLFRNFSGKDSLKLSFLMSIPAVLLAEIGLTLMEGLPQVGLEKIILGLLFSFIFGLLSIHTLINIAEKIRFWKFCILIGIIALIPLVFYL